MAITVETVAAGIRVTTPAFRALHDRAVGGLLSRLELNNRNLLRRPAGSALRLLTSNGPTLFAEEFEREPRLSATEQPDGTVVVIAEGTYTNQAGERLPVGFRRRTEYTPGGIVWATLDIMSDVGCADVLELRVCEFALSDGASDCFARFHPTQAGGADLLGACGHFKIVPENTAFLSRFTPLQLTVGNAAGLNLEIFPGSDLAQWDTAIKPDPGLGHYAVSHDGVGTVVTLSPYNLAFRQLTARVQGALRFRLGVAMGRREEENTPPPGLLRVPLHGTQPKFPDAKTLGRLRPKGIGAIVVAPPAGGEAAFVQQHAAGLTELFAAARGADLRILLQIAAMEWHSGGADFQLHAGDWMHMAAPSLGMLVNRTGGAESGALMCLRSGWLELVKHNVAAALRAQSWDGLVLDGFASHPCCHAAHGRGPYHGSIDEALQLLQHCRTEVNNRAFVVTGSGTLSVAAQTFADAVIPPPQMQKFPLITGQATLQ